MERADSEQEYMGLTTWKNAPDGKILKSDVVVAKNYLKLNEMKSLDRIVTMYLDYAELQAERQIPMTMEDWSTRLNAFLQFNEMEILKGAGWTYCKSNDNEGWIPYQIIDKNGSKGTILEDYNAIVSIILNSL